MGSGNSWGNHFRFMSFGESHGTAIGVVIDGCPSGLELTPEDIQAFLDRRKPGTNAYVSPRKEPDLVRILSGVYEGKTTGAPLAMIVENQDASSKSYEAIAGLLRPGYANFTYLSKWGHYDPRGGGRSSARETLARVCAGAVAFKLLEKKDVRLVAFVKQLGPLKALDIPLELDRSLVDQSKVRCPDQTISSKMESLLDELKEEGDSIGGVVEAWIDGLPIGLGSPVFDRFEARLAASMMSLPASRAFSLDEGFEVALKKGSEFNDSFALQEGKVSPTTNHASGVMGGLTTGRRVRFQVAFKPASSIKKPQMTCDHEGQEKVLEWKEGSRHDPSVVIRACPVVEAMAACVCLDFIMDQKNDRLETF